MGIEELKLIADILGGLESAGLSGFIWFLGAKVLTSVISYGVLVLIVLLCYKVVTRYVSFNINDQRLCAIGDLVGADVTSLVTGTEVQRIHRAIHKLKEERIKHEEVALIVGEQKKDLAVQYEELYKTYEEQKRTIDLQDRAIKELKKDV